MKQDVDLSSIDARVITEALRGVHVEPSDTQSQQLLTHAEMVVATNRVMNLTRITDASSVVSLHIVDSLAFLQYLEALADPILDLGSGAGYPGVPLAITGHEVTLCESIQKKAAFLDNVISTLGLITSVEALRAEELTPRLSSHFSTVVARAVAPLASLVELAAPLLHEGGRLVALKGAPTEEEISASSVAGRECGMVQREHVDYALPTGERRALLVYERAGKPRIALPRRPGLAQRQPLG